MSRFDHYFQMNVGDVIEYTLEKATEIPWDRDSMEAVVPPSHGNLNYVYRVWDGKGTLRMDDGMVLLPNDRYPLDREVFRLYYTSESEDQQTIDIYFEDNSEPAQLCQLTFDFNNETEDEDSVVTADSKELPVTTVRH